MKVYIQSNKYQNLASKVSKYSFEKYGHEVEIMDFEKNDLLKSNLNKLIIRNGKKVPYCNDLQSFTFLRFLAPQLNNYKDKILVIDPDIFAVKDPTEILSNHSDDFDISATYYNGKPRSEMMLIDATKVKWQFEKIINEVFNLNIDYSDLMNLEFDNNLKIKEIDHKFNSHDTINLETVLLHTTNRITQPWKEGLKINFVKKNFSNTQIIKEYVKKFINRPYNKELISKNFIKHPNEDVVTCVKKLFKDAKNNNYFNQDDIEKEYKDLNISKKIFE